MLKLNKKKVALLVACLLLIAPASLAAPTLVSVTVPYISTTAA